MRSRELTREHGVVVAGWTATRCRPHRTMIRLGRAADDRADRVKDRARVPIRSSRAPVIRALHRADSSRTSRLAVTMARDAVGPSGGSVRMPASASRVSEAVSQVAARRTSRTSAADAAATEAASLRHRTSCHGRSQTSVAVTVEVVDAAAPLLPTSAAAAAPADLRRASRRAAVMVVKAAAEAVVAAAADEAVAETADRSYSV